MNDSDNARRLWALEDKGVAVAHASRAALVLLGTAVDSDRVEMMGALAAMCLSVLNGIDDSEERRRQAFRFVAFIARKQGLEDAP